MIQPSKPVSLKRFYKNVAVVDGSEGHGVELDGRSIKTPERNSLVVPTRSLADAIVVEWERQTEEVNLDDMPLTRLAQRAVDSAGQERDRMIDEIMRYSGSDLLCYRATDPDSLVKLQTSEWQPVLDWAEAQLGVRLDITTALTVAEQPSDSLAALRRQIAALSDFELAGLAPVTALLGSIVLGLALHRGHIDFRKALSLSLLDEIWQTEQWGEEAEAAARRQVLLKDLGDLHRFLDCLG